MLIPREVYMEKLRELRDKDIVKVITGIRRSGKSTLLNMFANELLKDGISNDNVILLNLDERQYRNINTIDILDEAIYNLIEGVNGRVYLFIDEIQNVKDWEIAVNSYMVDLDCDIYLTGSNSDLLFGDYAHKLTGRTMSIIMYPLSFKEYYEYYKTDTEQVDLEKELLFRKYYRYGGLPFVYNISEKNRISYLEDVFNSILLKDVVYKHEIRDTLILEKLFDYIVDNVGNKFSSNSIHLYLKNEGINISSKAVYNYLTYMDQAFIINRVKREDIKGKKILKLNEKYFLTDHSFINMGVEKDISGSVLENIVYMELLRRGYSVTVGKIKNFEVDFICRKNGNIKYIQVAKSIKNNPKAEFREFGSLKKINDDYHKYVITNDTFNYSQEGIEHYYIVDFLLSDEI